MLQDIVDSDGNCTTCEEGTFPNGNKDSCSKCQPDEFLTFQDKCKKCSVGHIPSENRQFCKKCPTTLITYKGACTSCTNPTKE